MAWTPSLTTERASPQSSHRYLRPEPPVLHQSTKVSVCAQCAAGSADALRCTTATLPRAPVAWLCGTSSRLLMCLQSHRAMPSPRRGQCQCDTKVVRIARLLMSVVVASTIFFTPVGRVCVAAAGAFGNGTADVKRRSRPMCLHSVGRTASRAPSDGPAVEIGSLPGLCARLRTLACVRHAVRRHHAAARAVASSSTASRELKKLQMSLSACGCCGQSPWAPG